jgi:iron complex outermembrane receptor protein
MLRNHKTYATGITFRSGLIFLLDFYHIKVKDRVLFSGEVGLTEMIQLQNPVEKVLLANDTSMKFLLTQLIR